MWSKLCLSQMCFFINSNMDYNQSYFIFEVLAHQRT